VDFGKTGGAAAPALEAKPENKAQAAAKPLIEPKPEPKPEPKVAAAPDKTHDEAVKARALLEGKDPAKTVKPSDERLVIQVGAYTDATKVREARQKLEAAGFKTYTQVIDSKDGKRTRVRVGPFDSKAEADKSAQKIRKLQLDAAILKL
jgi:DedD protein